MLDARKWILDVLKRCGLDSDYMPFVEDGFDDAVLGITSGYDGPIQVVYSRQRCIDLLIAQGMTPDAAEEYFVFKVAGTYTGAPMPLFIEEPPQMGEKKRTQRKKLLA